MLLKETEETKQLTLQEYNWQLKTRNREPRFFLASTNWGRSFLGLFSPKKDRPQLVEGGGIMDFNNWLKNKINNVEDYIKNVIVEENNPQSVI